MQLSRQLLSAWPWRAGPAVAYVVLVFVASVADPPSGGLAPAGPLGLVGVDKWVHALTYAVLVVLVAHGLRATTRRLLAVAVLVAVGYGTGIEVVQSALPWRSFGTLDVLANATGAVLAGVLVRAVSGRTATE